MRFRLLGSLVVESGGRDVAPVRPKQRALLALLLLRTGEAVSTDELVDALWGERPPPTAVTALYGHISELRKRLGPERVVTQSPGYRVQLVEGDELDIARFAELTSSAHTAVGTARASLLADALALFRGEPLADFRYEPFAALEAARLDELRLSAIEDQLETELELGRHVAAIPRLEALIAEHPGRELLHAQLMLALFRAGRQADALAAFRAARSHLVEELGVEPSRGLRNLERRILNQDRELAAPGTILSPATSAGLSGIGAWLVARTRDESAAVRTALAQCGGSVEDASAGVVVAGFARARDAVAGALAAQQATATGAAIGIHSAERRHDAARGAETVARAAHAGDVLLSRTTRDLLAESPLHEVELEDAGRHRLDDLGQPWQLFRLVAPGLAAPSQPRSLAEAMTNLPALTTPFVGREHELRELRALVSRSDVRFVTLTGPAGIGKTRLALQSAATLTDVFPGGVFVVDLAPVDDPALVFEAIASELGLARDAEPAEARVVRHVRAHCVLLVLDNLEHLLPVASALADVATGVVPSTLLVTSRVPLDVPAEQVVAVQPLPAADAALLFEARVRAVRPDFDLTVENEPHVTKICARLDCLPLAIELAAPRAAVLSPRALSERLDTRLAFADRRAEGGVERHRTLQAAIDWSYELLPADCRRLFDALAVFSGGFDFDAAEAVVGAEALDAVDALATLVDASLVRADTGDDPRFTLLETVRAYAAEKLSASGEENRLRMRHAEWFLEVAERAEPHLREAPRSWLDRLEDETDNLRAALGWLEANDPETFVRLAASLWRFWYLSGRLVEGRRTLERAVASDAVGMTPLRAKALLGLTIMTGNLADYRSAKLRAEETIAVSREVDDPWTAAYATNLLARALTVLGDPDTAEGLFAESVAAMHDLGDTHSALIAGRNLALLLERRGERERARVQHQENLKAARESGNPRIEATTLGALAVLAAEDGEITDALSMLRRSVTLHRAEGDVLDSALDLSRCAFVLARSGDLAAAAQLFFVFEQLEQDIGSRRLIVAAVNERVQAAILGGLPPAAVEAAREEARTMTLDRALQRALESI